jgi:hypothetical protein
MEKEMDIKMPESFSFFHALPVHMGQGIRPTSISSHGEPTPLKLV